MKRKPVLMFHILLTLAVVFSCTTNQNANNSSNLQNTDTIIKKKLELSVAETIVLNAFFTSFSEIFLPEFAKGNLDDSVLIQFGVYYNYRNHFDSFKQLKNGAMASISGTMVNDTAFKFFGVKIKTPKTTDGIEYKNTNYVIVNSDGEAYRFSQIRKLYDLGESLYQADLEIYSAGSGFTGDINASPESWKTSSAEEPAPQSEGMMKAIIRKITENGRTHYELLEYLKEQ